MPPLDEAAHPPARHARASTPLSREPTTRHLGLNDHSESALAQRFVERHADELRFCAAWSKWLRYDGVRWQKEPTLLAFDFAHAICRAAAAECTSKSAAGIASAHTVAAITTLARADRRLAAVVDQWDADPWLLNTPGGTVNLRTGDMHPPDPIQYLTKVTGAEPRDDCEYPLWLGFLDRIFGGDATVIAYMQRVLGYTLTGSTEAQAMFFGYGTGANGKSVLLNTAAGILGDYHKSAPIETFTVSMGERHPTELAGLQGARLVTAVETEEGRRWAESRIKALTGGDTIAARFMRQDFFQFRPQFKLVIAGNHKPGLRSVDEAIRRRFNLIPFSVTIPPAERDGTLTERLKTEWPGILAWMIDGCLAWQKNGLCPPQVIVGATAAYLEAEDAMGAWIAECCECGAAKRDTPTALYTSWKAWAERAGEKPGSQKRFGQMLETRGFTFHRTNVARRYEGLAVRREPTEAMAAPHWRTDEHRGDAW